LKLKSSKIVQLHFGEIQFTKMNEGNELKTKNFLYSLNQEKKGPCTVDDLLDLYEAGKINENTQICEEKTEKWTKVSENKPLYEYFRTMLNEEYDEETEQVETDEVSSLIQELDQLEKGEEIKEVEMEEETTEEAKTEIEKEIERNLKRKEMSSERTVGPPPKLPPTVSKDQTIEFDEQSETYFYRDEGIIIEFNPQRNGWFPKLDQDLISKHSEIYGPTDTQEVTLAEVKKKIKKEKKEKKEKKLENTEKWNEQGNSSNIYVTGLPKDITLSEFKDYFKNYGVFKKDLETGEDRAKLYQNQNGENKGDGVIYFVGGASVQNVVNILDNTEIRPGYPIKIQIATFQKKDNFVPKEKKFSKKDYQKQFKQLQWGIEKGRAEEMTGPRVVILKQMFTLNQFSMDPLFEQNLKTEIKQECERIGKVEKIRVFKNHPEGIVEIKFALATSADLCIKTFDGRYFDERKISAELWDGKTKYNEVFQEDEEDDEERWENFGKNLDQK
jgi:HIV Tat-specific factor 1